MMDNTVSLQCPTEARRCRRRREDQRKKMSSIGRKNARLSFACLFLVTLVVGSLLVGTACVQADEHVEPTDSASEEEEEDAENLSPGDEADSDSDDPLPFLTDEDVECMNATTEFISKDAGLASAFKTYQGAQIFTEESGVELMGVPEESSNVMKSACELNKGYWAFVKTMKFTCIIQHMETIPMHVHDFGSCLAKTDNCLEMDTTSLLRAELASNGFNCWEDDESLVDGATSFSGNDSADAESSEGSESGGNTEENSDDSGGTDKETDSAEGENNDQDSDEDADQEAMSEMFDEMGLSDSETHCFNDSYQMIEAHPELETITDLYSSSIDLSYSGTSNLIIGFSDENIEDLQSVCNSSGGYFSFIEEQDFVCSMIGVEMNLKMTNLANCAADTAECRNMDILLFMESLWDDMGLTCTEVDEEDTTSSTTDTTEPDNGDSYSIDIESEEDDSLGQALGLTNSEVSCMSDSTGFVLNSPFLSQANYEYQKSVQMTDPTKLGYSSASALEMEQVCEDQGGLWSFIESEGVTCTIDGRDRCISVYNFGNCIVNNDDCQKMDPFVLVKEFFWEVLNFSCRAKCDNDTPHKNNPAGHASNSNNNLSSQQSPGDKSVDGYKLNSFTMAAIALCVVAAVAFAVFLRFRASHSRENVPRSAYEMTDISDLGFKVFT